MSRQNLNSRIGIQQLILVLLSLMIFLGCASLSREQKPQTAPQPLPSELAKVRVALEKYQNPIEAVRDGYLSMVGCIEYPSGGVGIRFLNTSLMSTVANPYYPPILIYEPKGEHLQLVAAEWLIPVAMGISDRPDLLGKPFDGPMEGPHPLMPKDFVHYDLHVWLFKDNPAGLYSPTNPTVKCPPTLAYRFEEEPPRLIKNQPPKG